MPYVSEYQLDELAVRVHAEVGGLGFLVDAHVDAAHRVDHAGETVEVDDRGAVELDAGDLVERVGEHRHAAAALLQLRALALVAVRERGIDLPGGADEADLVVGRHLHPPVARDRDQVRLVVRLRDVQDDDRVGEDRRDGGALLAGVDADQQQVDRAVDVVARLAAGRGGVTLDERAGGDRALRLVDHDLRGDQSAAARHHQHRTEAEDQARPQRVFASLGRHS